MIRSQFENLLSLVSSAVATKKGTMLTVFKAFSTEMVCQGQDVARLNYLAFVFIPLSFVVVCPRSQSLWPH